MAGHPRYFSLLLDSHPPFAESTLERFTGRVPTIYGSGHPNPVSCILATGSGPDSRMGWRSGGLSTSGIWARR